MGKSHRNPNFDAPINICIALEAIQAWRDPLWKEVFHETGTSVVLSPIYMLRTAGWLVTTCGDKAASEHLRQSYENLKNNNQISGIDFVETPEDLIHHVPQLKHARDISNWKGLWNKQAGWAHAHDALKLLAEEVLNFHFDEEPS